YSLPLKLPREPKTEPERGTTYPPHQPGRNIVRDDPQGGETPQPPLPKPPIPVWEGRDTLVSREVRIVGPDGEKVDVMTFRGSFERDGGFNGPEAIYDWRHDD